MQQQSLLTRKVWGRLLVAVALLVLPTVFMVTEAAQDLGSVADNVIETLDSMAKLITAAAYVLGMGFGVASVMKFKQHKDNPTQIPIGTPMALLFVSASLIFLPTIFGIAGQTIFGDDKQVGSVGGVDTFE